MAKRPIDALRDDPIKMEVGAADDQSPIIEMFEIAGVLHIIKGKGIYQMLLADDVDPKRTNPLVPNTHQRVLAYGADEPMVWQTLLTARRLFKSQLLGSKFEYQRALDLTFEALKDVVAMHQMRLALAAELNGIISSLAERNTKNRGMSIPAVADVRVKAETFLQKADHAIADLFEIAKLFYPNEIGQRWFESLLEVAKSKHGPDSELAKFLTVAIPFLKTIRNARNCIEHPKADQRIEVHNITLLPTLELRPPAIEIHHPNTPQPMMALDNFMMQVVEQIVGIFELMLSLLCSSNIKPFGVFEVQVVQYPPELQKAFRVRYGYGVYHGDSVVPFD